MNQTDKRQVIGGIILLICALIVPVQATLTITASDTSIYLGENITFSGINDETTASYLFLTGPNMPAGGGQIHTIDPASNPVVDSDSSTFLAAMVTPSNTWSWTWVTRGVNLDAGTYTIYVVTTPHDQGNLGLTSYSTLSLIIKKPYISITAPGSHEYYFGNSIRFSGKSSVEDFYTYLFITGPGLPAQGARLNANPKASPVTDTSPTTFTRAYLLADDTWNITWQPPEDIDLVPGTYTVFVSRYPNDGGHLDPAFNSAIDIVLKKPFISATVWNSPLPAGSTFTFSGTREGGVSPAYYVSLYITNASFGGSLPADGVKLTDFSVPCVTGDNSTFTQVTVNADGSWLYNWDTSTLSGGSLLPGSKYIVTMSMYPQKQSDATDYTHIWVGIEGPVTASYTVDTTSGDAPLTVQVTDTSTGLPTGESIYWGDGTSDIMSPGSTVTHTYTGEGVFFPQITVSNSISSNNVIFDPPISVGVVPFTDIYQAKAYNAILKDPAILGGTAAGKTVSAVEGTFFSATPLQTWSPDPARSISLPLAPGYLFFIDDYPEANWEHPCRYAFVEDSVELHHDQLVTPYVYHSWSPLLTVDFKYVSGDQPDLAGANALDGSGTADGGIAIEGGTPVSCSPNCAHNYALLLSGGYNDKNNYARYYNDILSMYNVLNRTYHYPKDHIWVLMSDGGAAGLDQHYKDVGTTAYYQNSDMTPFSGSTTGAATKAVLTSTMTDIRSKLTADDSLFIFTTNHGGNSTNPASKEATFYLWNQESIKDYEFVNMLPTAPKVITMVMEQCFGGGFIDDFAVSSGTQKRVITTAANWNEFSWGNGFSMAWMTGIDNPAYSDSDGDKRTSVYEAYVFGKNTDTYAVTTPAKETPQYSINTVTSNENVFLAGCSAVPTISVTSPSGSTTWLTGTKHNITWSAVSVPAGTTVNIELWKGTDTVKTADIANGVDAAKGYYNQWTIPTTGIAAGTTYYVRVYKTDNPSVYGKSSGNLVIKAGSGTNVGTLKVATTLAGAAFSGASVLVYDSPSATNPVLLYSKTTPALISSVMGGTKYVKVAKDGYYADPMEKAVIVPVGGTVTHTVILTQMDANDLPPAGQIVIRSTPVQDARVYIDDVFLEGRTTDVVVERAPGSHTIRIEHEGYITPAEKTVYIPQYTGGPQRVVYADFVLKPETTNSPEFPSPVVSLVMILGILGTVLYIRNSREP